MAQPDLQSTRRIADAPAGSRGLVAATVAYIVLVVAGLAALGTVPAASETGSQLVGVASRASQRRPVVHVGFHRWHARARGDAGARTPPAPVALQRCLFYRRDRHSCQQRRAVVVLAGLALHAIAGAHDGARAPRCGGVFWPDPDRRNHDHDGAGHAARVAQ